LGTDPITQLVPPSVVLTMSVAPVALSPRATQLVVEAQDTLLSPVTPLGAVPLTQVVPPSVVVAMPASDGKDTSV
jgi:hypothetical protein